MMQIFIGAVSIFLVAIFAGSAWHKAKGLKAFADIVAAYELAPRGAAALIARSLLAGEIGAAMLLLMSFWFGAAGLALSAGLFSVYAAAVLTNIIRGRTNINCGCGWGGAGEGAARLTIWHAARTSLLAVVAMAAAALAFISGGAAPAIYLVIGGLCAAPFIAAYAGADTLIENWSKLSGEAA